MRTEDGYLIHRCLKGDSGAFGLLVDKYRAGVYALAYSKLRNFHDAEDAAQEAFIRAYENLRKLRRWDSFASWLYRITSRHCLECMKSRAKRPDLEFIEDKAPGVLESQSVSSYREELAHERLQEALGSLPEIHREVLTMRYLSGMTTSDISRFVGVSASAVRKRLSRARALLKAEMLGAVETAFEEKKLQASFTLRIAEMVKHIRIRPLPRSTALPWGLSFAAGIILAVFGLGMFAHLPYPANHHAEPMAAAASSTGLGEMPVTIIDQQDSEAYTFTLSHGKMGAADGFTAKTGVLFSNAVTQTEWERYSANPVLDLGPPGTWDDGGLAWPIVLFDGAEFKMWYSGYDGDCWRIGCATSSDGIVWQKHPDNPVLDLGPDGAWDDFWAASCSVLFDGSEYRMWYTGNDDSHRRIGYATSADGMVWSKYPSNPVLDLGPSGAWDDGDVGHPTVLRDGSEFKLWYSGNDGSQWRIGYATSADGIVWSKHSHNPVLGLGANGTWDDYHVAKAAVLSGYTGYEMWYTGNDGGPHERIGYATSVDGIEWDKHPNNPVLDFGPPGTWDDAFACQPGVLSSRTEYRMWYAGMTRLSDLHVWRIGYAISKKCPIEIVSSGPVVGELYQFRDSLLTNNKAGQELISLYYKYSSEVADILAQNPTLSARSAVILRDVMPGIRFLLGDRRGSNMAMTPLRVARIKKLFADIGAQGSGELAGTLSGFSDQLEGYKGTRISRIWQSIDRE